MIPITIRRDSDIRPADAAPPYCSSCRQQQVDKRHIDFDAPCDRGYTYGGERTRNGEEVVGSIPVPLDWLILCEDCIRIAGELTGMVTEAQAEVLKQEAEDSKKQAEIAKREQEKAERYAGTLEDAFDARPQPIKVDHRKKPRQRESLNV